MQEEKQGLLSKIGELFWSGVYVLGGLAFGLFIVYIGMQELDKYNHWDEYQRVNGKVTKLYIFSRDHNVNHNGSVVKRTSWYIGGEYNYPSYKRKVHFKTADLEGFHTEDDAKSAMKNHKVGEIISVWFHPDTPDEPILEYEKPTLENSLYLLGFGGLVLLIWMGMLISSVKDYLYDRAHPLQEEQ